MPVGRSELDPALSASRDAIKRASEKSDRAARNLSRVHEPRDDLSIERRPSAREQIATENRRRDISRDMLDLSEAVNEVRANTAVARTVSEVSSEINGLGSEIDIRA